MGKEWNAGRQITCSVDDARNHIVDTTQRMHALIIHKYLCVRGNSGLLRSIKS